MTGRIPPLPYTIGPEDRLEATLAAIVAADTSDLCQYAQHRADFADVTRGGAHKAGQP